MISGICKADCKHPKGKEETWVYYPSDENIPNWTGDECARLMHGFVKVDIDDYDKKTGSPINFIKGERRSDVIRHMLDNSGIKYNLLLTERGKHFYFKLPENLIDAKKINWYSTAGIEVEYHPGEGTSKTHIPYKVNGIMRTWEVGSLTNIDIDYLPVWLYPLQKSKDKPFSLSFPNGDRTQQLGAYLFHLVNKGFTAEQAFEIVQMMNSYVFESPIDVRTLEAEILNDSTLAKLQNSQKEKSDKNISHVAVGDEIINRYTLITVNGDLYSYVGGVYTPYDDSKIVAYISEHYPTQKINFKREVESYIKGKTYKEYPQDNKGVNVKNGILQFDKDGNPTLLPQDEAYISFTQFNTIYDPSAQCKLLDDSLFKMFSGSSEQIELFNQLLGYLLMNHVKYQKIFFFMGLPSTGKTTLLMLIRHFCGKENVSAIQLADMGKTFGLATIVNKTANIFSDIQKTKMIASDVFKMLADGSPIKINQKYKKEYTYCYTGKLLFGMNSYPDFSKDLEGIERRLVIFEFKHVFHKDDADFNESLQEDLSTDECMSALLNKAIIGYKSLITNKGFNTTNEGRNALNDFMSDNDNVLRWLHDAEITEDYLLQEPIRDGYKGLYPEYTAFCISIGEAAKEQKDFSRTICQKFWVETCTKRLLGNRLQMFRKK